MKPGRAVRAGQGRAGQGWAGQPRVGWSASFTKHQCLLRSQQDRSRGGQHIEVLGSDVLGNWVRNNALEVINDRHWQRRILPSGETTHVEVKPPKEVLKGEEHVQIEAITKLNLSR